MSNKLYCKSNFLSIILPLEKSFEMFPRHNGIGLISVCFALNLIISVPLTNK